MKNKKGMKQNIITGLGVVLTASVIVSFAYIKTEGSIKQTQEQASVKKSDLEEIESMKKEQQEAFNRGDFKKYNELVDKIGNKEIECGTFDYKGDLESRLGTIEVAMSDTKRAMDNGWMPEDVIPDANNRIEKLTPVVLKYRELLKDPETQEDFDYKELNEQFDSEITKVYHEIN